MKKIPENIGELRNLKELNLEKNDINSLPLSFFSLNSLKNLNLGCNRLNALPESIAKLTSLEDLDISLNNLETLPQSITNLKSLIRLNIELNPIISHREGWDLIKVLRSRGVEIIESRNSYYESLSTSLSPDPELFCPACKSGNFETDSVSYWVCHDCGLNITKG